jgi:AhpD family alkylhydroperoxidase
MEALVTLYPAVWFDGPLSPAELEMVRLRNAHAVGCVYCKAARYDIAREDGLDEDKVALISRATPDSDLSAREQLILAYTDAYLNDPESLAEDVKQALLAELGTEGVAHLAIALGIFNGTSRGAVAFGGMPEEDLPVIPMAVPV